jgi:hypothetical protein
LFENAMQLVAKVIPEPSEEQIVQAIHVAQASLWKMGLTGVHDFDQRACFTALQVLHQRGELHLRVLKSIPLEDLDYAAGMGLRTGFGDDMLRIGGVKAFADGALGPQTAAMLQPYEGSASERGMLLMDGEQLYEQGRKAVENGLALAVHAIGDRANHEVLEGFAQLRALERELAAKPGATEPPRLRHRIEHVQLLHPQDTGRLAELGVIASMQPIHATSDMHMAERYWGERSRYAYGWKTQLNRGARLAFGSDAPVESPNPFWGLHAAVTRRRQDGSPGEEGWYPHERLTLEEALKSFTRGPAYAAGMEERLGRLAPGCLADLIVLEEDPFHLPAEEIWKLVPRATMVDGEWMDRRE